MGSLNPIKTTALLLILLVTGLIVHVRSEPIPHPPSLSLGQALDSVEGWTMHRKSLSGRILEELDVDDYINASFTKDNDQVHLYIGQYYSSRKISAAHSPLVCFPGQGWDLEYLGTKLIPLDGKNGTGIHLTLIRAAKGQEYLLGAYWYQANLSSAPGSFQQKLTAFWQQIRGEKGWNAYLIVSSPIKNGQNMNMTEKTIVNFLGSFYPVYLNFINSYLFGPNHKSATIDY